MTHSWLCACARSLKAQDFDFGFQANNVEQAVFGALKFPNDGVTLLHLTRGD